MEYFVTNGTVGNQIRDAISGTRYNYFVGSNDEDFFFKVKYYDNNIKCDENTLFFSSPEDCERLLKINVSQKVKETWYNRMNKFQQQNNQDIASVY